MEQKTKQWIALVVLLLAIAAGAGIILWQKTPKESVTAKGVRPAKELWTCSMHPFIVRDKPGNCPVCGMQLIRKPDTAPVPGAGAGYDASQPVMTGHITLSPTQRVMANVATAEAAEEPLDKEINAAGIVQYDQSRQAKVTAWVAGRLDRLLLGTAGSTVTRGMAVAEIYSPDLYTAQQEYLLALRSREQLKGSSFQSIAENGELLVSSARQRLRLLGVNEGQIARLGKTGKASVNLAVFTPYSGVVIEKMVQQGQYVNAGDALFSIADLSKVWVEAEVYENDFASVHKGLPVDITSRAYPSKTFNGKVSLVYPVLDPKTRTVRVRVELMNPDLLLKPEMFVNATIRVPLKPAILVPVTALIDTGRRQVLWVESSPGMFEPRNVEAGQRTKDKVQILSGIRSGEKVVVSGAYLIDSESQLRGTATGEMSPNMPGMKQ